MCKKRAISYVVMVTLASPMLFGLTCPPPPPPGGVPTTLLNTTVALIVPGGCGITQNPCGAPLGSFAATFNPLAANKLVTASVTGSLGTSQPQVEIQDFNTGLAVANSGLPSSSTATATFTSIGTGILFIQVCECGSQVSPEYTINVTQAP